MPVAATAQQAVSPHLQTLLLLLQTAPSWWLEGAAAAAALASSPPASAAALPMVTISRLQCSHTRHASVGCPGQWLVSLDKTTVLKAMVALRRGNCFKCSLKSFVEQKP